MIMSSKAVVLGTNYYIGLSIVRRLGSEGVHVVAVDYSHDNCYGSKSKYINEKIIAPHYRNQEEELVDFLIEYAKNQDEKPLLMPSADPYVEFMDKHLEKLKEYYHINMTDQGLWSNLMDKDYLHQVCTELGVLVPEIIRTTEPDYLQRVEDELGFPCIVKPSDSPAFVAKFRNKMFKCGTLEEVEASVKKANDEGLEVFVQRIIPGFDDHVCTFDAYMDKNSEVTHWMTCQKQRQYPINFGASVFTIQKMIPELEQIGAPLFKALAYKGFAEIEFKKDAVTGDYYLIEINVRTTNLDALLDQCGINFPILAYKESQGMALGSKVIREEKDMAFHYLFEDILACRGYVKTNQLTWGAVLKSLFIKKAPAIWSWDDPMPGIDFTLSKVKKVFKRR